MKTIAVASRKGGVAKTTTALALASDLARRGHIMVLGDLGAQGNPSPALGRVSVTFRTVPGAKPETGMIT